MPRLEPDLAEFLPAPPPCLIARHLEKLDEQNRVNLEAALGHPDVKIGRILAWFKAHELPAGEGAVRRHRRGECVCGRN